jgi:hypothetical protein
MSCGRSEVWRAPPLRRGADLGRFGTVLRRKINKNPQKSQKNKADFELILLILKIVRVENRV